MRRISIRCSIRWKLIFAFSSLIAATVILAGTLVYQVERSTEISRTTELNQDVVNAIGANYDNNCSAFIQQMNMVTMNEEFQSLLVQKTDTETETLQRSVALRSAICGSILSVNNVESVYLYESDDAYVASWQKHPWNKSEQEDFEKLPEVVFEASGAVTISEYKGKMVFSRRILSLDTRKEIGKIVFVYDSSWLRTQLNHLSSGTARLVSLVSPDGELFLYNSTAPKELVDLSEKVTRHTTAGSAVWKIDSHTKLLESSYACERSGWKIVCLVDLDTLLGTAQKTLWLTIHIGIAISLLGFLLCCGIASRITKPLESMKSAIRKIEQGDYKQKLAIRTGDEIEELSGCIDHLVTELDDLINRDLKTQIAYKDMQIIALQAQINPHFLFNTLECINSLAQLGEKDAIREVTVAFSNIMKSMIHGKNIIDLAEELSYTRDFLSIYKILMGEKLSYDITVEEELESVQIPRMTIQPVVENSVIHGIRPSEYEGHISVSVSNAAEGILISVIDDGIGFSQGQLEELQRYIAQPLCVDAEEFGGGIKSVVRRLRLFYEDKVTINVTSYEGNGTAVDILIPTQEQQFDEEL